MNNVDKPRNILVVGGLHGDETLGIDLVNLICDRPIPGVEAIFGNPMAAAVNARYIDRDLNRVFPGKLDGCLEEVRAHQIMQMAKGYDLVIDFHNTTSDKNDCAFIGELHLKETLYFSLFIGLNRVIIATYDCINKFLPNCLSIEISYSSHLNNAKYWYERLVDSARLHVQSQHLDSLQLFKFFDRVYAEEYQRFGFRFQNFVAISSQDKCNLHLPADLELYAVLVDPSLKAGKYCALVEKIS